MFDLKSIDMSVIAFIYNVSVWQEFWERAIFQIIIYLWDSNWTKYIYHIKPK